MKSKPNIRGWLDRIWWITPVVIAFLVAIGNNTLEQNFIIQHNDTVIECSPESIIKPIGTEQKNATAIEQQSFSMTNELGGRVYWIAGFGLYLLVAVVSTCICIYIMHNNWYRVQSLKTNRLSMIAGIAALFMLCFIGFLGYYTCTFLYEQPIFNLIGDKETEAFIKAKKWEDGSSAIVSAVVLLFIVTTSVLLIPNKASVDEQEEIFLISRQMKLIRLALYAAVGLLVTDVIQYNSLMQWSLVFIEDDQLKEMEHLVKTLVFSEGIFYSILLAAIYIPAMLIIKEHALKLIPHKTMPVEQEELLKKMGLTLPSPFEQLKPFLAILSPLITGASIDWIGLLHI